MNTPSHSGSSGTSSKFRFLARAGYIAKGVVYATVGLLTLGAIHGWLGTAEVTGTRGALEAISEQRFGRTLLVLMTVGLAGYVGWRLIQSIADAENKGNDLAGLVQRTGFLISALAYAALALYAAQLAGWLGPGFGGAGEDQRTEWTGWAMRSEAGIWAVGAVGLLVAGVGVYQFYRAATRKFEENLAGLEPAAAYGPVTARFAQFGVAARGLTLLLIGWVIVIAAWRTDPDGAQGLGQALRMLQDETYGTVMLTMIGAGLICYGLYCLVNARYRRFRS